MSSPSNSPGAENKVNCQYCGWPNAISLQALERVQVRCARCKLQLSKDQNHLQFRHLDPAVYMHFQDSEAMERLKKLPGALGVVQKMAPLADQMFGEAFFAANGLRISDKQYPDLYAKLLAACETMGIHTQPHLYLSSVDLFGEMGMYTYSGGNNAHPFIAISPLMLEELDEMDVLAALAHELGHIHCGHMDFKVTADFLCLVVHKVFKKTPLENIAESISLPVQQAILTWRVKANLSADRTALLVTQQEKVLFSLLLKLAGGTVASRANLEAFAQQALELNSHAVEQWLEKYWQQFIYVNRSFQFPVWRAAELIGWTREDQKKSYGFKDIVKIFAA